MRIYIMGYKYLMILGFDTRQLRTAEPPAETNTSK